MIDYPAIAAHYEACYDQHGDTPQGMDWPNAADAEKRFEVMLGLMPPLNPEKPVSLLDVGCGTGHLLSTIQQKGLTGIHYQGMDMSERFIAVCQQKFPDVPFFAVDVLKQTDFNIPVDYMVLNGVFTEKVSLSFADMLTHWQQTLTRLWPMCREGLAFNVMAKQVDWERDDLFHLPMDTMAAFVYKNLSRHVVIRNDYGLYEYTVYVYRNPR